VVRRAFWEHGDCGFVFGNYLIVDSGTGAEELVDCSMLASDTGMLQFEKCLLNWKLYGGSPCKKSTWESVGGYDEDFSYGGQDVDFWMQVFRKYFHGAYINACIYRWVRSSGGMNARRSKDPLNKLRIIEKNIATFDAFGLGDFARHSLMRGHLLFGDGVKAKKYAREKIRLGQGGVAPLIILFMPVGVSRKLINWRRRIKRDG
jgi:hypothetical protein